MRADGGATRSEPPAESREILLAALGCLALTIGLYALGAIVPWIRANLVALFALVFLQLPTLTLPRTGPGTEAYGLTTRGALRGAAVGAVAAAALLVAFVPAYHVWATHALGLQAVPDAGAYRRPSEALIGEPSSVPPGDVAVFRDFDRWHVNWTPAEGPWRIEVHSDAELWRRGIEPVTSPLIATGDVARPVSLVFRSTGGTFVDVRAFERDEPVPLTRFRSGPGAEQPPSRDGFAHFALSYRWFALAVVLQLFLIALPEEFFYRGYLQARLASRWGGRGIALGPLRLTQANVVTSALFAVGHVVIGGDPARLAVFFPSLLFGMLRERTDGIAAGVVFHACCNLMLQLVAVHYV